mmetsp:Transcript_5768/g.13785  ORF Transcript_5768/g.13785 Transcript_5768/m.13785 type:complete len:248 (-) Transcript_5768:533-1276(-)
MRLIRRNTTDTAAHPSIQPSPHTPHTVPSRPSIPQSETDIRAHMPRKMRAARGRDQLVTLHPRLSDLILILSAPLIRTSTITGGGGSSRGTVSAAALLSLPLPLDFLLHFLLHLLLLLLLPLLVSLEHLVPSLHRQPQSLPDGLGGAALDLHGPSLLERVGRLALGPQRLGQRPRPAPRVSGLAERGLPRLPFDAGGVLPCGQRRGQGVLAHEVLGDEALVEAVEQLREGPVGLVSERGDVLHLGNE